MAVFESVPPVWIFILFISIPIIAGWFVEHVTVNSGGQAIVGNVERKTGGEGKR